MNPYSDDSPGNWNGGELVALEDATVITAPSHTQGDDIAHAIEVKTDTYNEPTIADVRIGQAGDTAIPPEGARVIVGFRANGRPTVLGVQYGESDTIPDYEAGERIIGHPLSDSYVKLASDGTLRLYGDGGNTVELQPDGSVVVNGGDTQPVTNVDFANETVTRADGVYLPSQ